MDRCNKMLVKALEKVLADSYALFLKSQNYHWNVEGRNFRDLHLMFEDQYKDLFKAIDEVAELIRGLGVKTIGTFSEFSGIASIKDGNKDFTCEEMLKDLCHDQELIESTLKAALKEAQALEDEVVCSFVSDRLTVHRKTKWILKSFISLR